MTSDASRLPLALWELLFPTRTFRRNFLSEAEKARDADAHSGSQPDGLEAFDFLHGWKGRE